MTESGPGEGRRRTKKSSVIAAEGGPYRPYRRTVADKRSPYPVRGSDAKYKEEEKTETELAEESEVDEVEDEMSRRGEEENAITAFLQYMREKDERDREERREAEEARRIAKEQEGARDKEEEERRRRRKEEKDERRQGEEAARRREEDERRRDYRREDDRVRERRELLQEKLKGLGVYKEGTELGAYLSKFERIMREGEIREVNWGERLYPRLTESLCVRVAQARDKDESYKEIRRILLKATGETAITYGNQLLEASGDLFKSMSAAQLKTKYDLHTKTGMILHVTICIPKLGVIPILFCHSMFYIPILV